MLEQEASMDGDLISSICVNALSLWLRVAKLVGRWPLSLT
jgi:hypothetical protein